jgi:hypothetical protein
MKDYLKSLLLMDRFHRNGKKDGIISGRMLWIACVLQFHPYNTEQLAHALDINPRFIAFYNKMLHDLGSLDIDDSEYIAWASYVTSTDAAVRDEYREWIERHLSHLPAK